MSGINWGLANPVPQPVLWPGANKREREKTGDPVPAWPDWLCITSPEYAVKSRLTGDDARERTPEELELIEAAKRAEEIEKAEREKAKQEAAEFRRAEKKKRDEIKARERAEQAAANKLKGFGKKTRKPSGRPKANSARKPWT